MIDIQHNCLPENRGVRFWSEVMVASADDGRGNSQFDGEAESMHQRLPNWLDESTALCSIDICSYTDVLFQDHTA